MKVKFKKLHKDAVVPAYTKVGDNGLDLVAIAVQATNSYIEYSTGIAVEIPEGYVGLLFPRSSITKKDLILKNSVGVIDSNYRGELSMRFDLSPLHVAVMMDKLMSDKPLLTLDSQEYKIGDRIGQLVIVPCPFIEPEEAEELSDTVRGTQGYGSSGDK